MRRLHNGISIFAQISMAAFAKPLLCAGRLFSTNFNLKQVFNKKFKVGVKHFSKDKCEVQFTHYYFIPVYHSLCFWFEQSLTGGTECWLKRLMDYQTAENLAKSLKSIEDVRELYKKDEAKEQDFYRRKKEYYAKNVPYDKKYF